MRSGTTFLRNVLRQHPNLAAPEETHFFRWPAAFGTNMYLSNARNNATLKKHRELDQITETEFNALLKNSKSRAGLQKHYMELYMQKNKPTATRWFDKTPQNIYGATLIAEEFRHAKFVHIVRNPVNVIASLRIGKVVKIDDLAAACAVWNEAAMLIHALKKAYPRRVYEVKYEDFTTNLMPELEKLLQFIDEDFKTRYFNSISSSPREHDYELLFSPQEIKTIRRLCKRWMAHYGYDF